MTAFAAIRSSVAAPRAWQLSISAASARMLRRSYCGYRDPSGVAQGHKQLVVSAC